MHNGSAAGCAVAYDAPDAEVETIGRKMILRLRTIPWTRVIVDTLLIAGILFASSNFLTVR
jgi:hypothetical protein